MKLAIALVALMIGVAAVEARDKAERVATTGTVVHEGLEGGFWAIKGDDGGKYDPHESLPKDFRKKGMKVKFEAVVVKDAACIHMWGTIVKIEKIEEVK